MNTNLNQTGSNERDELIRMLPKLEERNLMSDRQRQLQEFMMSEIDKSRTSEQTPRRVLKPRFVVAATALAAVAAVAVVATTIGNGGAGVGQETDESQVTEPSPVAETFELAAAYAADQPFDPPSPDQWIYVETQNLISDSIAEPKGQDRDVIEQSWMLADGTQMAGINPETGELETWEQDNEYPELSALPTDPEELLDVLREELTQEYGGDLDGEELNAELFSRVSWILMVHSLPPDVTAALWQAAAQIPGVTEIETVEVDGRELIAVGRIVEKWRFEQLLVDPETYAFVGIRGEAVKDFTMKGGNDPIEVKKGEVLFEIIRLAEAIVDAAGETG
ncbi:CU044_5270 family protein [Stackebrandtia soli]|uniref:CU044_5270 family protein n=1 Tax=Stackebrandtia soli TaxID=1892856 RepID=UPI0039E8E367